MLRRALPTEVQRPHHRYWTLVGTSLRLLADEPLLRRRAFHGACGFAAFSVLWTTLAFLLSGAPFHYSNAVIGLFGLVGAGGILAANLAGKLADADHALPATAVAGLLLAGSFGILWLGRTDVAALIIGIVVLDIGTQGLQITNQAIIYALRPDARSRINSAYMVCYFAGGAIGSVLAGTLYSTAGWAAVCILGAGFGLLTTALTAVDRIRPAVPAARQAARPAESTAPSTAAGHGTALRAPVGVAGDRVVEGQTQLVGQRCQPGQQVGELVQLLGRRTLAHRLGQLAQLLGQPGHGGIHAPLPVPLAVGAGHQVLEFGELHRSGPNRTRSAATSTISGRRYPT